MSKAKTLAGTVSTGGVLADGTVAAAEVTGLATVATSGSYNDLSDKPTTTTTATNLAGGSNGTIPYQSASGTTQMLAVGTAGQLLQTNGAGAPTWITPAAGSGTSAFTASSDVTAGAAVAFKTDGTVRAAGVEAAVISTAQNLSTSAGFFPIVRYDTVNNKYVFFYVDTGVLYGVVGTPSGNTLTLGTPVAVIVANVGNLRSVSYDTVQNVFLLGWLATSSYAYATCCAVNGTSLTVGGSAVYANRTAGANQIAYAAGKGCHVMYTTDSSVNPSRGYVATISTSGNGTPSVSTLSDIGIDYAQGGIMAWNPVENKARCVIRQGQVSAFSYYYAISVSGTGSGASASASGDSSIGDYRWTDVGAVYDSVSSSILQFFNNGSISTIQCVVFNSSGSRGSVTGIPGGYTPMLVQSNAGVTIQGQSYVPMTDGSSYWYLVPYTITGTSVSFGTPLSIFSVGVSSGTVAVGTAPQTGLCYYTSATTTTTIARLYVPPASNISGFIGVAKTSVSSGASVDVNTLGAVNTQVTGLTAGSTYYLDNAGALTTTSTTGIKAGRALSATSLFVTGGHG
jgi:hypothetical protein